MALTYKQIWEQRSRFEFNRRIFVKRLNPDGSYEASFNEIPANIVRDSSVSSLKRSLPNSSWQFGRVLVNNARLNILSPFQEFASENEPNSLFVGFIRDKSIIKIQDALIDKYTDPDVPEEIAVTTFEGLIDAKTATTEIGFETLTALDFISVLATINVQELTLTQTTLNALVFEVMNRVEFTKFFTVSSSTTFIDAGYNATSIDTSVYEGTVLQMLEDLAKGHSIFYIDPDNNTFHFLEVTATATVQHSFLERNNRKLSIKKYREGVDRQITKWFWDDTSISSVASPVPVNPIPKNFSVDGITDATQRQNTLDFVLSKTEIARPYFNITLPYFPIIKLLDRVVIQAFGQANPNAPRWGMVLWTTSATSSPATAPRYTKPAGIRISSDKQWMVRGITHTAKLETILEVELLS